MGSDDQTRLYLNSEEVYRNTSVRELKLDEDEVRPIRLRKGTNVLVFKVVNEILGFEGSLRFVTKDGATPLGIEYRLTP